MNERLGQPLDRNLVQQRKVATTKTGKEVYAEYLAGHVVIAQANDLFGFGEWSYRITFGPEFVHGGYRALVQVQVGNVVREDVGFAVLQEDKPEEHDHAMKAAVTDAMKRGLRTFGAQFGNELYGSVKTGPSPSQPPKQQQARNGNTTRQRAASQQAADSKGIKCAQCGSTITAGNKADGTPATVSEIIDISVSRYNKELCIECMRAKRNTGEAS